MRVFPIHDWDNFMTMALSVSLATFKPAIYQRKGKCLPYQKNYPELRQEKVKLFSLEDHRDKQGKALRSNQFRIQGKAGNRYK